jgi:hypothetical protein
MRVYLLKLLAAALILGSAATLGQDSAIVINEIHCNADVETELVEFVELYNSGTTTVNLSGWFFSRGITYTFPAGSTLAGHGYLIVAENPAAIHAKWGSGTSAVPISLVKGPYVGKLSSDGETVQLCNTQGQIMDEVDYKLGFPWPTVGDAVPENQPGTGRSMQLVNPALDNDLGGSWRSAYPTPAKANSEVFLTNAPPLIRQVKHSPKQPKSNEVVTITAKATDDDGIFIMRLLYQIVEPGSYVPVTLPSFSSTPTIPNPDYGNGWVIVTMHDDGLNGDETAGDDIFTARIPASVQKHRRLVRYTLAASDPRGSTVAAPYPDDPQPNFAYFVYDGVPAWKGAIQPGSSDPQKARVVTYSAELMQSLPVYHLIARAVDVDNSQYNSSYNSQQYHCSGTLVYDDEVYDNIHYRIRGTYSTYMTGKNKWKFDFNRGHYFQARDDYGDEYKEKWDKMNLGTGTCPWWQYPHPGSWDQGTQGMVMNEVLGFRLYTMAGVACSTTNYLQLRIVDDAVEASPTNQYEGDFWGLYFTIEQVDGVFLDQRDLPDGNVYRMEGGINPNHQGATDVANTSDVQTFINTVDSRPSAAWWAQNVNLAQYYGSKTVGVAINDSDRRPQYNCLYYHNSETGQWWMIPWDLDLSFEWGSHYGDWEHFRYALSYPEYGIVYENRARELLDLLFNGDQVNQLIDEIAAVIATPIGGSTFVEANRALWDYHPRTVKKGQFYQNNEFLTTRDWPGLIEYYKAFLSQAGLPGVSGTKYGVKALVDEAANSGIPNTPVVTYTGPAAHPAGNLKFQTTNYQSPSGSSTFAAVKWRLAEVETGSQYVPPTPAETTSTTLVAAESENWRYFKGTTEPSSPVDAWRQLTFNDSSWLVGQTSIGYGDNDDNTTLSDMQNHYSSVYLRRKFIASDVASMQQLTLRVYIDDGCVVWINGKEAARLFVPSGTLAHNAFANPVVVGDATWEEVTLSPASDYLIDGINVIAIHALNADLGSSDLSIDVVLTGESGIAPPAAPGDGPSTPTMAYPARRGLYEVDAAWESEEVTPFSNAITIPASEVKPGATYRVRCRMKDKTGRWSHWSAPVQFTAGQ